MSYGVTELPVTKLKREKGTHTLKGTGANMRNVVPVLRWVLPSQLHPKPCQVYAGGDKEG